MATKGPRPRPLAQRLWAKSLEGPVPLHRPDLGPCLLFTGHVRKNGYGAILAGGDRRHWISAHVAAWVVMYGPVQEGFEVCHKCDVRNCIRPTHLFLGTRKDNMLDAARKGRTTKGERNPMAKLTWPDVEAIRTASGTQAEIATRFGITNSAVQLIRARKRWVRE